jgi:hypothetical protein
MWLMRGFTDRLLWILLSDILHVYVFFMMRDGGVLSGKVSCFLFTMSLRRGTIFSPPIRQDREPPYLGCQRLLIQHISVYPSCLQDVASVRNLRPRDAVMTWDPLKWLISTLHFFLIATTWHLIGLCLVWPSTMQALNPPHFSIICTKNFILTGDEV